MRYERKDRDREYGWSWEAIHERAIHNGLSLLRELL